MKYLFAFIAFHFVYCSGIISLSKAEQAEKQLLEDRANQEEFDPEILPDRFVIDTPSFDSYLTVPGTVFKNSFFLDSTDVDSTISIPGFRIQIFTSTSFIRSEEVYENALTSIFDKPIYKIFDPPFYKIRVGNFTYREEAEFYNLQEIRRLYSDSWVVQSTVQPYDQVKYITISESLLFPDLFPSLADSVITEIDSIRVR